MEIIFEFKTFVYVNLGKTLSAFHGTALKSGMSYHRLLRFSLKPYPLAGFEPGSAVSEADAMSIAPRRQGQIAIF
jgi:hypothetical protein